MSMAAVVRTIVLLWLSSCSAVSLVAGQQWDRFRGPNGAGESDAATIPTTWTIKDYKWRIDLPGSGHSSPVVWSSQVYVTSAIEADASRIVCCLNASDGGTAWKRAFASQPYRSHNFNSLAAATPAVDKDRVYVTWTTPEQYTAVALDRLTGEQVWRRDLGPFVAEHGSAASPILCDDLLIVPNDQEGTSSVIALEAATGKTRWSAERRTEKASYSTPVLYRGEKGVPQLVLTSRAHGISGLDPQSGKTLWELGVLEHRTVGSPLVAAGLIFASCGEGGGGKQMLAVRPGDPASRAEAKVVYRIEGSLPYVVTPVAYGAWIFFWSDQGVVQCLDIATGKMLWRRRVGGTFFGSPVRIADRLYCISRQGEIVVLAAAAQYKLLGRVDLGEPSHSTPAVAGGTMYLRTRSHLMAPGGKSDRSPKAYRATDFSG